MTGSWLLRAVMAWSAARYWWPVERMTRRPAVTQRDVLLRLLRANADTRFGREHGFAAIRDAATFADAVPVQEYEMLRPYIEEQRRTGALALTAETPLFYAQTSGTTGAPKYLPVTASMLVTFQAEQRLFSYLQFRACPAAFAGKILGVVSPAVEGRLDSGHAVGSVSGYIYQTLPQVMRERYVLPPEISSIPDYDLKYLVMVRLALAERGISWLGSPNPSTFLRLLDILNEQRAPLLDSLRTGTLDGLSGLDPVVRRAVEKGLRPDPQRAADLDALSALTFANVWPGIRLVTTWTGGNCGIALGRLRTKLPREAVVMELGYMASELRGTLPLDAESPGGLPALHHHFFEFVEQTMWDAGTPEFLTLDRLEVDKRYYILVTTAAGLYRYFMNDLLEVTGFHHDTPLLRFLQKGRGVTSITGEKLYETQTIEAVRDVAAQCGFTPSFYLLIANEERSTYRLFIELEGGSHPDAQVIAAAVDRRLGESNLEYQGKRASGRLGPLTVAWLRRGAAERYKAACVQSGQREGQFKPSVLQYKKELIWRIDDHVIPG